MSRKKIIAGNWKMNMTPSEAVKLVETLKPLVANDDVDVVFCVPAIDILPVVEAAKGSNIQVGAENMYFEEKGAFTGEISPNMLTAVSYTHLDVYKRQSRKCVRKRRWISWLSLRRARQWSCVKAKNGLSPRRSWFWTISFF